MTKKFNYVVATATTIAMLASATPAFAWGNQNNGGDVNVENKASISVSNWGSVVNSTTASASTGGNTAGGSMAGNGSTGGNGDEGGNATANADATKGDATAGAMGGNGGNGGKGGNGGNGGVGGQIQTGNATAEAGTMNQVNTNDVSIEGCACGAGVDFDEDNVDDINVEDSAKITLENGGFVMNYTDARATTGDNKAEGSTGGDAGKGGNGDEGGNATANADANAGYSYNHHNKGGSDANAGAQGGNGGNGAKGGNGGVGGAGGLVITGAANSVAGTINVVNTNLVRIVR